MTQEDKELLLKDLCARLPYKVKVHLSRKHNRPEEDMVLNNVIVNTDGFIVSNIIGYNYFLSEIKPYLRPLSSMTEEEKKEFAKVMVKSQDCSYQNNESATTIVNDWYLSKGFDVRGLIPKGLALEALEGMYK